MRTFKKATAIGLAFTLLFSPIAAAENQKPPVSAFSQYTQTIKGKKVTFLKIDLNNDHITPAMATAHNKINQTDALKNMAAASQAVAAINGTYFAAYNNAMPLPDGTLVKDGKVLHITDAGCTVGFTPDNQVLIDFVKTRVQGYINDEEGWVSYRINRSTPDPSATVIYTEEYAGNIVVNSPLVGVICQNGEILKKSSGILTVPSGGLILVMNTERSNKYNIGDKITLKVTFEPQNTPKESWMNVTNALSAGPSLLINGKSTPVPTEEGFTEEKILVASAQRSFIGTNTKNELIIGTTSASIVQMKEIAKALGLTHAMCLDGGASSGLYYKNSYLLPPGRQINNCIYFLYQK